MRKTGPILILIIGVLALFIDFFPNLRLPDGSSEGGRLVETKLGLDLQGGLRVEYQAKQVGDKIPGPSDLAVIRQIIENRVNSTGVSEPVITTQGTDRIVVELPGVSDPNAVRRLVGQTGRLDFVPLGTTQKAVGDAIDPKQFPALFSGEQLESAAIGTSGQTNQRVVTFVLKPDGAKLFGDYTAANIGKYFAIVLDGKVISAPVINSAIPGGHVEISSGGIGGYPLKEAQNLVTVLQFGSLPFPIAELSNETISATLGEQFLSQSLMAGAIGIGLVILFMLIYYRLPGDRQLRAHLLHARRACGLPARPGHPDPRRHRRLRALDRHGGRRQHPDLRTDEGGDAPRQVAALGRRGRLRAGRTRSSTRTCRA